MSIAVPPASDHSVAIGTPAGVLTDLLHAVDDLDWPRVRRALADTVVVDYTSLFGGDVETVAADALVERWQGLLPGFDATQHLTGPVLVRPAEGETGDGAGDEARVETHVRGYHYLRGPRAGTEAAVWMVAGHYEATAVRQPDGWRITSLTLRTFYEEGDRSLVELAAGRATTTPRPSVVRP